MSIVNNPDSVDFMAFKVTGQLPGNWFLKLWFLFWNCVGGTHLCRCLIFQITNCAYLNLISFHSKPGRYWYQKMGSFLARFLIFVKNCRKMPTYTNTQKKQKLIFDVHAPGNCFEFGIIWNDFRSSAIWILAAENPGIQPIHRLTNLFVDKK